MLHFFRKQTAAGQVDWSGVMFRCRMLRNEDSSEVLRTMVMGFSDYVVKLDIDEAGYRHKFMLDGVDYLLSAGIFDDQEMIGVTMNGVGHWNGLKTVYDAGTVVIPSQRRKGASTKMFDFMMPRLADRGLENYLLEVICDNEPALKLYRNFGFRKSRKLGVFYKEKGSGEVTAVNAFKFLTVDLKLIKTSGIFDDRGLAWQNSNKWIERTVGTEYKLEYIGAFSQNELVGFGIISPNSGKVLRVAVVEENRGMGIGRHIVRELARFTTKPSVFLNIDLEDQGTVGFLESIGCEKKIEQFEMEYRF